MASAKSVEDMLLCSDIDESAVNALVGSLESQLSSPGIPYTRTESSPTPANNSPSFTDANLRTLNAAQKHGALLGTLLNSGSTTTNKTFVSTTTQRMSMSPVPMQNAVMSGGTSATLPAGAFVNSYGQTQQQQQQQAIMNSAAAVVVSSSDIKVPYSSANLVQAATPVVAAAQYQQRNNLKLQNGVNPAANATLVMTSGGVVRNGPTVVCQNNNSPAVLSTIQTVTTMPPPQTTPGCTYQSVVLSQQQQQTLPSVSTKSTTIMGTAVSSGSTITNVKDSAGLQSTQVNAFMQGDIQQSATTVQQQTVFPGATTQPTVIASTTKSNPSSSTPVNVMTQVVTNQHPVPGIQVVNVNPTRFGSANVQRALAPRVVISSNQIRIAPQMIRHGMPVPIPGQNAIAIPPGLRGTLMFKTENGQYQIVNIGPGVQSAATPPPGTTAYRLQTVHPNAPGGMRALVPQQVAVTVANSVAATTTAGKSSQSNIRIASQSVTSTVLKQAVPLATMPSSGVSLRTGSSPSLQAPPQASTAKMSSEAVKQKCRNFLATLMKLAAEQPKKVATNVKRLIQGLIDGTVPPEDFTTKLQKELNSSPQPCLVPFLKKSLPYLRHALITKEVTIEGVNPPPPTAYMMPTFAIAQQLQQQQQQQQQQSQTEQQPQQQQQQQQPPALMVQTSTANMANSAVRSVLTAQLTQPAAAALPGPMTVAPRVASVVQNQTIPRPALPTPPTIVTTKPMTIVSPSVVSAAGPGVITTVSSPSVTAFSTQSKISLPKPCVPSKSTSSAKDKKAAAASTVRDEDDINDVAAMGGVNLIEESQKILATNSEHIGTQIRSCKDDNHLLGNTLQSKIILMAQRLGLSDVSNDAIALISHATQERLKTLVGKLNVVAEHRTENIKMDPRYEVTHDVRSQVKFLEELDRLEKKKHEEQERELLLRAAKSRSKLEDPEQLKLKQKAKEMQKAEIEELRQREANMTALLAIGPRKKLKTESSSGSSSQLGLSSFSTSTGSVMKPLQRPRVKRVNFRDLLFVMEQDRDPAYKLVMYKAYTK